MSQVWWARLYTYLLPQCSTSSLGSMIMAFQDEMQHQRCADQPTAARPRHRQPVKAASPASRSARLSACAACPRRFGAPRHRCPRTLVARAARQLRAVDGSHLQCAVVRTRAAPAQSGGPRCPGVRSQSLAALLDIVGSYLLPGEWLLLSCLVTQR